MPAFPDGLEIDHKQNLNGTMGAYAEQILIATGKDDWKSRIEEEDDAHLQRQVKDVLGRKGELCDPYHNVLITNVSFPGASKSSESASAYLFPSFKYIPSIPLAGDSVKDFIRGFAKPKQLHRMHKDVLSPEEQAKLVRHEELQDKFARVRDVDEVLVLICGHGGRDARCGILGPLLRQEFEDKLRAKGIDIRPQPDLEQHHGNALSASVGLISHIGGHKYAGNVIIYIPKTLKEAGHPLAGKGIWYGRVGPEQVEGVVEQTIVQGKVVKDLFRGGIEDNDARTILRL
ncbi:Altered inheritance of mitochondria protein 32 [Diplodia seriata]|uniref:Altered inheritance of mitochondria protein 32 n=2 Tax=Diplodia seriata TaxID=420778 RepID=A0A1S8B8H0_9PEZI|nr:Altered inheritance of mitochondria protein 32 [Diplodia seriata]